MADLRISHGDFTAGIRPKLGGSLVSFRRGPLDILRAGEGGVGPLDMASFALVPYANRIAHGRFEWAGRERQVPLNFGDHPHALHGLAWQSTWEVAAQEPSTVLLRHSYDGGSGWSWAYEAERRISLDEMGLHATLSVTNRGDEAAPFGLGFHPYFEAPPGTQLRARVAHVWLADETCIPERRVSGNRFGDWSEGGSVHRDELIDHCFTGWNRTAEIIRPDFGTITLTASPELSNLHLYMPPGSAFFCAEPVSHMPDAINRPDADEGERMHVLQPGETLSVSMRIEVGP